VSDVPFAYRLLARALLVGALLALALEAQTALFYDRDWARLDARFAIAFWIGEVVMGVPCAITVLAEPLADRARLGPRARDALAVNLAFALAIPALVVGALQFDYTLGRLAGLPDDMILDMHRAHVTALREQVQYVAVYVPVAVALALQAPSAPRALPWPARSCLGALIVAGVGLPFAIAAVEGTRTMFSPPQGRALEHLAPSLVLALLLPPALQLEERALRALTPPARGVDGVR
jgi:hypothetical protein